MTRHVPHRRDPRDRVAPARALGGEPHEEGDVDQAAHFESTQRFVCEQGRGQLDAGERMGELPGAVVVDEKNAKLFWPLEDLKDELMEGCAVHRLWKETSERATHAEVQPESARLAEFVSMVRRRGLVDHRDIFWP